MYRNDHQLLLQMISKRGAASLVRPTIPSALRRVLNVAWVCASFFGVQTSAGSLYGGQETLHDL